MRTVASFAGHDNNFDLIRILAAIGVLFSHAYPAIHGKNSSEPLKLATGGASTIGELCVAIFFVISGFLISQSFDRARSLVDYFSRRILRIVPGLAVVTVVVVAVLGPLVTSATPSQYWSDYLTWRYFGNALVYPAAQKLPGVFENLAYPNVTNASIWTLSYEMSCYICVAAIGLLWRRMWWKGLLMASVAAATVAFSYISVSYFLVFGAFFSAGSIAYILRERIQLRMDFFCIAVAAVVASAWFPQYWVLSISLFGTYVLLFIGHLPVGLLRKWTGNADLSYGTYLYAWPVQQVLAPYTSTPAFNFFASLPVVLALAYASWRLVEKPCLGHKHALASMLRQALEKMR